MDKHTNQMEIEMLGGTYTLRASFQCLKEIEIRTKVGIYSIMVRMIKSDLTVEHVAAIVYAGLKGANDLERNGKKLMFEDVAELCFRHGFVKLMKPVGEFLALAMQGDDVAPKEATGEDLEKKI